MALLKDDAMMGCRIWGKQFIKHFDKIYIEWSKHSYNDIDHHISEMQSLYDNVMTIKIRQPWNSIFNPKYRSIKFMELTKWFYTTLGTPEDILKDEAEYEMYDKFIIILAYHHYDDTRYELKQAFKILKSLYFPEEQLYIKSWRKSYSSYEDENGSAFVSSDRVSDTTYYGGIALDFVDQPNKKVYAYFRYDDESGYIRLEKVLEEISYCSFKINKQGDVVVVIQGIDKNASHLALIAKSILDNIKKYKECSKNGKRQKK